MRLTIFVAALVVIALGLNFAPSALAAEEGKISGTVTNLAAVPIQGIEVCAFDETEGEGTLGEGFFVQCATTDNHGEYTISGLPAGEYEVEFAVPFESELNYVSQYYDEKTSSLEANRVRVNAGNTTPGIDARLAKGGWVAGRVTDALSDEGIGGIEVCAFMKKGLYGRCVLTNSEGKYKAATLPSGNYDVDFFAPALSSLNYVGQYYDDKSSLFEATEVPVVVEEETAGIDAALQVGGQIAGRVTDAATGAALEGTMVCAFATGVGGGCASTGPNGEYMISGLPSGSYTVWFNDEPNFIVQYYNGVYQPKEAQAVAVVVKSVTSGIDAALEPGPEAAPANTGLPTVSGTPTAGSTLSCVTGSWTGRPAPKFTYQWLRDGIPISGANASSYVTQSADEGRVIACEVIAKNGVGSKRAISAMVTIAPHPVPPPPVVVAKPQVTLAMAKARVVVSGGSVSVRVKCADATCRGTVELTVEVVGKRHRGRRGASHTTLVLAKGTYSLAEGQGATVVLHLTNVGRKRLAHAKHHPVAVKLTVSVAGGNGISQSVRAT
jgi:hypothetical protein